MKPFLFYLFSVFFSCFFIVRIFGTFFADGVTHLSELFALRKIFAVGIKDDAALPKIQFSRFINVFVIDVNGNDFGDEHIVASEMLDLFDFAFQRKRALSKDRRFDSAGLEGCQFHFLEFIGVAAGAYAAEVGGTDKIGSSNVDAEFAVFLNNVMAEPFRTDRNVSHGGTGIDDAGPTDGQNVGIFHRATGYKCGGSRGKERSGFPNLFCHRCLPKIR